MVFKIVFFSAKRYEKVAFSDVDLKIGEQALTFTWVSDALSLETADMCKEHQGICTFVNDIVDKEVIERLRTYGIKVILCRCAGFDNVDLVAAKDAGIAVLRVPAYSPYAVAEFAMALLLCLNRKIHRAYERNRVGNFALDGLVGIDFHGKTAGVVGTGKIGQCFIDIVVGFGCDVLCYDVYEAPVVKNNPKCKYVPLEQLLAESDFASIHAPLLPSTRQMFNKKLLDNAKNGILIVNTSRGGLVQTEEMIDAVKSGKVGGYATDVYDKEAAFFFEDHSDVPMIDDTLARLQNTQNILLTAHQAFLTKDALCAIATTTINNAKEFIAGRRASELTNIVLPEMLK